jgi:hypothetical protein
VNGRAELWLDGVSVGSVAGDLSTPSPYSRVYLWNQAAAGSVWFDDIKVASTPSGPVGAVVAAAPGGRLQLAPASVAFGPQTTLTTSGARPVTLSNTGGSGVTIAGIEASADFAQSNDCPVAPATLPAGASCTVSVTIRPSATGQRVGALTVDDDGGGPHTIGLSGTGVAPGTYLSDDFDSGSLGQWDPLVSSDSAIAPDSSMANSGSGSVRLTNNSPDQSSRLMADLAGGGHAQSYTRFCFRIAAGLTEGIEIANGRAITGEYPLGIRRFVIDYNPATKGLEGYFFNEALQRLDMSAANGLVLPERWYCAELFLDESADGHARLWLDGVLVGSVDGDLSTPSPFSRFYLWNQAAAGTVWFDDVKVADAQIGPVGAGAAALPGPQASLGTTTLSFASQAMETTSAGQTVTLTNTGSSALTIGGFVLTGPNAGDFTQTNTCPATLAAGASCSATVTFRPTATGSRTASLTITDDGLSSPHVVALSGTGAAPPQGFGTASPMSLSFGGQPRSVTSATLSTTLTNTGTQPLTVETIGIPDSNEFAFTTFGCLGATLAPGASCRIDVTFTPLTTGLRTGTLTISTNVNAVFVGLSGTGTLPTGSFLVEDFESSPGVFKGINDGSVVSQPGVGRGGTRAGIPADTQGMYADFAAQGQLETHTRFCVNGGTSIFGTLAQGREPGGQSVWEIDGNGQNGLEVYIWNAARVRSDFYASNVLTPGSWSCFDVDLNQAVSGGASVSLDGTSIAAVSGNFGGVGGYSRLLFGGAASTYVDDVSVRVD